MTESVNDDDYHGRRQRKEDEKEEAGPVTCLADQLQPSGSADGSSEPAGRGTGKSVLVGRAPWQETMDISHEIGSTHNRQFPRHLTSRAVALMNVTILCCRAGEGAQASHRLCSIVQAAPEKISHSSVRPMPVPSLPGSSRRPGPSQSWEDGFAAFDICHFPSQPKPRGRAASS